MKYLNIKLIGFFHQHHMFILQIKKIKETFKRKPTSIMAIQKTC